MKFVIVGDNSRALSLIGDCLSPYATVYKELFNRHDPKMMEELDRQDVLIKIGQDPIEFLEKQVFVKELVGFLLLNHHAHCASWSRVWGFLRDQVKIIVVKRNPFASLSSHTFIDHNDFVKIIDKHEAIQRDLSSYFEYASSFLLDFDEFNCNELSNFLGVDCDFQLPVIDMKTHLENYDELYNMFKTTSKVKYLCNVQ